MPRVFYLSRTDINTDEIIPAKYLDVVSKEGLGQHVFEDLVLEGFDSQGQSFQESEILVVGANFGCGSSREHAVWAIQDAGFTTIVAPSFARIFRENAVNCGLLLAEVEQNIIDDLMVAQHLVAAVDLDGKYIQFDTPDRNSRAIVPFQIDPFSEAVVRESGLPGYALKRYGGGDA